MDPSQDSKRYQNLKTSAPYYHQQGTAASTTAGDSVMLRMLSASKPNNSDSPDIIAPVVPMVSENLRQLPISTQTSLHSFLYNRSSNVGGVVEMGYPNVPLVTGPNNMSFVSDLTDHLVQNSQRQTRDNLHSANLLSLLGSQFSSLPTRLAAPTQGFPSVGSSQLGQASGTPFLAALMQQMLYSSLNTTAAPVAPPPMANSNLVAQLIAQFLNAQLAQSAQPGPLAGLLQLIQAFGSMTGSTSSATPLQASSRASVLPHLSSLDPATAKQVILMLVNQLVQSGNLTDDETCKRFVEKLQSSLSSSTWQPTQSAVISNFQTVQNMFALNSASPKKGPIVPENIKTEIVSSAGKGDHQEGFSVSVNTSASSPRSGCDGKDVTAACDAASSTYGIKVDAASEQSKAEISCGPSVEESIGCQKQQRTQANGSSENFINSVKHARKCTSKTLGTISSKGKCIKADTGRSRHDVKQMENIGLNEITEPPDEKQSSGKRLRSRTKTVRYCEEELTDGLEHSDTDTAVYSKKKKSDSRAQSNSQDLIAKERKTNRSISCGMTQSSGTVAAVISCRNASNSQTVVKSEITGPISVLPKLNTSHSPNVRYLFMGRKSDGMDWLNLVSYKTMNSDDSLNQCLFCPMTSSDVKPVADHIANEHGDLDFVLTNIKQPNGRIIYLACRHCNFVTFEPTLMWIHFELYHGIPGIMDGSSLPRINICDPVNVEEISLDELVNSKGCQPAYVCLDCMLCSNNSQNIAMHVIQAHPDTANFNGCFVKLMMIKSKEKDCFTFREALFNESHANTLKDVYVCMLCEYSTHGAYLAMSHSLRLHQTKRLLFVCNDCEYQCTRETNLMMHMASSHKCSSTSSFSCSVTLIVALSDGTFIECKFPGQCQKTLDDSNNSSDCEMKSSIILQSTAVSSSQEKGRSHTLTECEESTITPPSDKMILLDKNIDTN